MSKFYPDIIATGDKNVVTMEDLERLFNTIIAFKRRQKGQAHELAAANRTIVSLKAELTRVYAVALAMRQDLT